ncbi:MAG: HlyD family type I secretion periplasmic adaptor subunit, partial [Magnetococcales bacterium]|nr:HlyD family type I secretion periplasmic adaptor subunit [Magnetococcales bacterium]
MSNSRPLPQHNTHLLLYLSTGFLALLLLWAAVSLLDVVSRAQGVVMPSSRIKAIQHLEGGIVQAILVQEGEKVTRYQPLLRLDPVRAHADLAELQRRLVGLQIEMARITAEVVGQEIPQFSPQMIAAEPALVEAAQA